MNRVTAAGKRWITGFCEAAGDDGKVIAPRSSGIRRRRSPVAAGLIHGAASHASGEKMAPRASNRRGSRIIPANEAIGLHIAGALTMSLEVLVILAVLAVFGAPVAALGATKS